MQQSKQRKSSESVFLNVDEYVAFTQKYGVYGGDAVKLKKEIDRQLTPKIKPK